MPKPNPSTNWRKWFLQAAPLPVLTAIIWALKHGEPDYPLWPLLLVGALLFAAIFGAVEAIARDER